MSEKQSNGRSGILGCGVSVLLALLTGYVLLFMPQQTVDVEQACSKAVRQVNTGQTAYVLDTFARIDKRRGRIDILNGRSGEPPVTFNCIVSGSNNRNAKAVLVPPERGSRL
ncbi:hypothetical protein [Deinococcus humi]|uniref:Uncharacterized protein n=1 Tax=Deinococcus humi TaxID=662880 RepID=A0A7W8JXY0_9DEIO|nr:hypothetical protein [Deinococcus humi]MBB5365005.1 hypothetical protein [Deinococcus humi]GGO34867.1 hypothetical protein GCM10008949_36290 [Deinococcus humi]